MHQHGPKMTQHDPTWPKIDLRIFIFAMKTNGFLMILNNHLFRVLALLGIHLRPLRTSSAHFGLPLGFLWGHPGLSWGPQGLLGASLGTILAYLDLPLGAPGRP